jgi:hypothetical protein
LAGLFSYEELRARAQPLPELAPQAFAACPVDALLLACMHRCGHKQAPYYVDGVAHYSGDRLIWLYDIHLLAVKLTSVEWHQFIDRATRKGNGIQIFSRNSFFSKARNSLILGLYCEFLFSTLVLDSFRDIRQYREGNSYLPRK